MRTFAMGGACLTCASCKPPSFKQPVPASYQKLVSRQVAHHWAHATYRPRILLPCGPLLLLRPLSQHVVRGPASLQVQQQVVDPGPR